MRRLFVYGSLRKGEINHDRFEGSGDTLVATGTCSGALLKNLGEYPAMIRSANHLDLVVGEVYEVPDSLAEAIDAFEREADYEAQPVTIVCESGNRSGRIEAVAYFIAYPERLDGHETVQDGDWARHHHLRATRVTGKD